MPAVALKHFDLARQFAPKDRDIEQLQVAAALAVARQMTDQSAHSGLDEPSPPSPRSARCFGRRASSPTWSIRGLIWTKPPVNLGRKQEAWRKTGCDQIHGRGFGCQFSQAASSISRD